MSAEQEEKDKLAFAGFLLDCRNDAFTAALKLYPTNHGLALRVSNYWPIDPVVMSERARLSAERASMDPTSVADYIDREARRIIEDENRYAAKDRLAALELLGKLRGVINAEQVDKNKNELPTEPTYRVVTE